MTKNETKKLLNQIKGYYNSQFFVDEYVLDAWTETMEHYSPEDASEHLKEYIKEYPDTPPKPQTFIRGLLTSEEKRKIRERDYSVSCNLCGKWMSLEDYDKHYDKCLDIQYLIGIAKQQGKNLPREDLEGAKPDVIKRLMEKYKPKGEMGDLTLKLKEG